MSKITLKCKKYKRKCIDKALSVYLEKAGYIFDSSSAVSYTHLTLPTNSRV